MTRSMFKVPTGALHQSTAMSSANYPKWKEMLESLLPKTEVGCLYYDCAFIALQWKISEYIN